jgi:hypothetical protein
MFSPLIWSYNWYDDFEKDAKAGKPEKEHKGQPHEAYGGWAVRISWLKEQIAEFERRAIEDSILSKLGQKTPDPERYEYMVFVVTKDKKPDGDYTKEKIVDPTKHRLWIRGFKNPQSFAEDFPPIQWP